MVNHNVYFLSMSSEIGKALFTLLTPSYLQDPSLALEELFPEDILRKTPEQVLLSASLLLRHLQ